MAASLDSEMVPYPSPAEGHRCHPLCLHQHVYVSLSLWETCWNCSPQLDHCGFVFLTSKQIRRCFTVIKFPVVIMQHDFKAPVRYLPGSCRWGATHFAHTWAELAVMANTTTHIASSSELQPGFKIAQQPLRSSPVYLWWSYIIGTPWYPRTLHQSACIPLSLSISVCLSLSL